MAPFPPPPPSSSPHHDPLISFFSQPSNVFTGGSEDNPQYKIGDYGTMREVGRKHLHYFVSVEGVNWAWEMAWCASEVGRKHLHYFVSVWEV